ncbi:MAG: helix-turn-helix domain-containing protein [Candidatus Eremiobacteraeota bacterium]|nr:helix-turn-helix domain-containing protein [Candidatus Eremiobacteraeota bacterium]
MKYPAKFEKEILEDHDNMTAYSLQFIDFPDAITQGESLEELVEMGQDVLSMVIESMIEDNEEVPLPSKVEGEDILHITPYPEIEIPLVLKNMRKEAGLTQKQVAEKLRIPWQTYQKIERAKKSNITLRTLFKLARAFGKKLEIGFS